MERHPLAGTSQGYIYGVTHPSWPGCVKIGKAVSPIKRVSDYNTGCPNRAYALEWSFFVEDRHTAEMIAKRRLAGARLGSTEWFAIHPIDAFQLLQSIGEDNA